MVDGGFHFPPSAFALLASPIPPTASTASTTSMTSTAPAQAMQSTPNQYVEVEWVEKRATVYVERTDIKPSRGTCLKKVVVKELRDIKGLKFDGTLELRLSNDPPVYLDDKTKLDDAWWSAWHEKTLHVEGLFATPLAVSSTRAISPPTTGRHIGVNSLLTPSSLSSGSSHNGSWELGSLLVHPWFVQVLSILHSNDPVVKYRKVGREVHRLIIPDHGSVYGPRAASATTSLETTMTSLVADVITRACAQTNLHWIHQAPISSPKTNCTADIIAYRKTDEGLLPVAVMEFGTQSCDKIHQALGYIHNMDHKESEFRIFPKDTAPLLVLAITWLRVGTRNPIVRVDAAYGFGKEELRHALLFDGLADCKTISRVIEAVMCQCDYSLDTLTKDVYIPYNNPWPGGERNSVKVLGSNVVLATVERQPYVYKLYNYLDRPGSHHANRRKPNEAHYPGGELIVKGDDVQLLRYRYVEGKHYASHTKQAAALVQQLIALHAKGLVHGDIRASNVVFAESYSESRFIDFDFAGRDGKATYPKGFNGTINDGERHPKAKAGELIKKKHDWFSLRAILVMHTCGKQQKWKDLLNQNGSPTELATALSDLDATLTPSSDLLELFNSDKSTMATGSPTPKDTLQRPRSKRRRSSAKDSANMAEWLRSGTRRKMNG